ncbi:MAG: PEP-CTERM sorting domain-containing protein [Nitrospirales bacterium]
MPKALRALIVLLAMGMGPVTVGATDFVSSNAADVAAFQAGATVLTFESIPGITAFNNESPGTAVPASALLKNQIAGLTFFSNFSGGPFVLDLTGFGNISDAKSGHNILSGTEPGSGTQGTICFTCFIEVTFASPVSRVGAWNDPTGSRIQLLATDAGGTTIFGQPFANQGQFVGVSLSTNSIDRALFQYISTQSVAGFTLDDVTYGRVGGGGNTVPEPTALVLFATGATALFSRRLLRHRRS